MPTFPELQTHQPGEPVNLSNIQYPITEWISAGASNEFERMVYLNTVENRALRGKPDPKYPGTMPVTQTDIDGWKTDRPDLPNIPLGTPRFLGEATVSLYDNDRNLAMMNEAEPQRIGKAAAWGSSMATSFLDYKATLAAIFTGGIGRAVTPTIARLGMLRLGASELFGSKAANIGTQIAQNSVSFGLGNVGFQAEREVQEQNARTIMQQPHEYIQSLQNIGVAGAYGVLLGGALGVTGASLLGRRVMRFEDGSFIDIAPDSKSGVYANPEGKEFKQFANFEGKKWQEDREGGLFNRSEFNGVKVEDKQAVVDNFKPWTKESDITMTEEATGQMMNGQYPDVSIIMKQGIADAGETFRQAMRDGNVDIEALASTLEDASDNIKYELSEAVRSREELRKSTRALEATENLPITEENDLSQKGMLRRAELAQFEESIMKQSPELVPENVRKFIELQREIDRLTEKAKSEQGAQPSEVKVKPKFGEEFGEDEVVREKPELNKKVMKRIEALKKKQPKILSPKEELKQLRRKIAKTTGNVLYGSGEDYQRLSELAKVWKSAEILKNNLDLTFDFEGKIDELSNHDFLSSALLESLRGTHEYATPDDVQNYAAQLQSTGIPEFVDTAAEFEPQPEKDIDAYLAEYSPEQVKSVAEIVNDKNYSKQLENATKRLEMVPKMREMVTNMTDCLLKGA